MFHNLYPLSSTGYMNLRCALFLHDLIFDVEIDICAHIFHVLRKTVLGTESWIYVPFCCLISRILKLKGILPTADESPCTKSCPINMYTFNTSIDHSWKRVKPETSTSHSSSHFSTLSLDENLTTLWHLFTSWVPRCQNSHLFYTITALGGIWSLPPYKLNWIRFKGS